VFVQTDDKNWEMIPVSKVVLESFFPYVFDSMLSASGDTYSSKAQAAQATTRNY